MSLESSSCISIKLTFLKRPNTHFKFITINIFNLKYLSNEYRNAIFQFLLENSEGRKLKHALLTVEVKNFNTTIQSVSRIWKKALLCFHNDVVVNVDCHKKGMVGRKKKDYTDALESIRDLEPRERSTLRSISSRINLPLTTLHRLRTNRDLI